MDLKLEMRIGRSKYRTEKSIFNVTKILTFVTISSASSNFR